MGVAPDLSQMGTPAAAAVLNGHMPYSDHPQQWSVYQWVGRRVIAARFYGIGDTDAVTFVAEDVVQERRGAHSARLSLYWGDRQLAYDTINFDASEKRIHLANAAHSRLPETFKGVVTKYGLQQDLDGFCDKLWGFVLGELDVSPLTPEERIGEPPYLLKPFVLDEASTCIFGPPGFGKSYIVQLWASCIESGKCGLWTVERRPVFYVNLERSKQSVQWRQYSINRALGLDRTFALSHAMHQRGRSLVDIAPRIEQFMAALPKGTPEPVLFLDSISRAGGGDLNENWAVNRITDQLNRLAKTWVAIGHSPRSDSTHIYGSVMFEACADLMVQLSSQEGEGQTRGVGLKITKKNDVPSYPPERIVLEFGESGLVGVRRASAAEFLGIEDPDNPRTLEQLLVEYVKDTSKTTATRAADALKKNRSAISQILANHEAFVFIERDREGAWYGLRG